MTIEWELGDRVGSKGGFGVDAGELGTVCDTTSHAPTHVGVRWDKPNPKYHDCMGACERGYGWYMLLEYITKLKETEVDTNNPLYNFRAHEELGEDAWGGLSKAVYDVVWGGREEDDMEESGKYTWEYVGPYFKQWELEYKKSTELPIPGAWRSAKSVIKNAMEHDVAMWEADEPRGKTAVEKDIKGVKERAKEDKDPQAVLDKLLEKALRYHQQHTDTLWAEAFKNASDAINNARSV